MTSLARDRIARVSSPADPLRAVLDKLGDPPAGDPLVTVDALLRRGAVAVARLGDALSAALARAGQGPGAGRLLLALASAQLVAGDPRGARDLLLEAGTMLPPDDPATARLAVRLASAELAAGNRAGARAALGRVAARLGGLDGELLREAAQALAAAGEELAGAALLELARGRREGGGSARLEVLGRLVGVLNSGAAGTAEPLWAVLRAILDESGADRGCLMLYSGARLEFELGLTRAGQSLGPADFAYSTTIVEQALEQGRCVVVPDVRASLPLANASSAQELGLRAAACAPLKVERKRVGAAPAVSVPTLRGVAGVLYVDARTPGSFGGPEDARFFEVLADCAVLAVRAKLTAAALAEAAASDPSKTGANL